MRPWSGIVTTTNARASSPLHRARPRPDALVLCAVLFAIAGRGQVANPRPDARAGDAATIQDALSLPGERTILYTVPDILRERRTILNTVPDILLPPVPRPGEQRTILNTVPDIPPPRRRACLAHVHGLERPRRL